MARQIKGGKWEASRRITTTTGKKQRRFFYGETEAEAEGLADRAVARPEVRPLSRSAFFGFVVGVYLPTVRHLRPNSKIQITWALEKHLYPTLKDMRLEDIDLAVCQGLLNRKAAELSPWSVRHIRKVLSAILSLAEFEDLIRRNPCTRVKLAKPRKTRVEFYKPWEMWKLYEAARGTIVETPILLACFCGLRRGEALGANRQAIKGGKLEISKQLQKYGDKLTLEDYLKTGNSYRTLPIPADMVELLKGRQKDALWLCPNSEGGLLSPDNVDRGLYAVEKRAGLRKVTFHQLRHSFSANLELMGCPTVVRLALMGQSSEGTVATLYTHETQEAMAEWLRRLWVARMGIGDIEQSECKVLMGPG